MRYRARPIGIPLVLLLAAAVVACRPVSIETEPGPAYMVDVRNRLPEAMIVQFEDGRGARMLGTVAAGATERFVIAAPDRAQITIVARNQTGSRQVRRDVVLQPGIAVPVDLTG